MALLQPKGTRARLEYSVTIDGSVERNDDIGATDRWSTHRTLTVAVDLEADKPSVRSPLPDASGVPPGVSLSPDTLALQQEATACGGDVACQMRVAEKMMALPETQDMIAQAEAEEELASRYQSWRMKRGTKADVRGKIETNTYKLFFSAGEEHTTCKETADLGADALVVAPSVVVDAEDGVGHLMGALATPGVMVDSRCDIDMPGRPRRQEVKREYVPFFPTIVDVHRAFPGEPPQDGGVLARGQIELDGSYGDIFGTPKTGHVVLRWTLTKL